MTYTRPGDFYEGYIFSAADFNMYLRDNFMAAVPDIFEQAGDLAMGDASADAVRRHPKSSLVGQLLTSMSGVLAWHRPYVTLWFDEGGGEEHGGGAGEVLSGLYDGAVAIDIEDINNWDEVTPQYKFVVAGWYLVVCATGIRLIDPDWRDGVTGYFTAEKNGALIAETAIMGRPWPNVNNGIWDNFLPLYSTAQLSFVHSFAVDDVLELVYDVVASGGMKTSGLSTKNRGAVILLGAT